MSNVNLEGLPPEMQQRIASIIGDAKQKQAAVASQPPTPPAAAPAPIIKPPSLMDHTISLRQEVAALRQELHAVAQVTDAVGQAVGQLYQMFCQQTETTDYSSAYEAHAQQEPVDNDY